MKAAHARPRRASARRSAHVTTVLPLPLEGAATMKRGMDVLTGAAFPTCGAAVSKRDHLNGWVPLDREVLPDRRLSKRADFGKLLGIRARTTRADEEHGVLRLHKMV